MQLRTEVLHRCDHCSFIDSIEKKKKNKISCRYNLPMGRRVFFFEGGGGGGG